MLGIGEKDENNIILEACSRNSDDNEQFFFFFVCVKLYRVSGANGCMTEMSVRTWKRARKQTMTKLKSLISELKFKRRAKTSKSTAHSVFTASPSSILPLHIRSRSLSHTHLKTPFSSSDLMKFVCIFRFVNKINFLSHGIGFCWWAQRGNDVRACVCTSAQAQKHVRVHGYAQYTSIA